MFKALDVACLCVIQASETHVTFIAIHHWVIDRIVWIILVDLASSQESFLCKSAHISLLKTLQWLPVALRIKNNFILRWSTDVFRVSPPPTCSSGITPISTAFRSGHTGLSAPLTSDPVHVLVNSYSSFVSWIKTGFLRSAFPVFL